MPELTHARTTRNRWLRVVPQSRIFLSLIVAAVLIVVGYHIMRVDGQQPKYAARTDLIRDLRGLLGENDLFMRPGLSPDGASSWSVSAYGLPVITEAGLRPSPMNLKILSASLRQEMELEPVWARWYAMQVEQSANVRLPGSWAEGILEDRDLPEDPATLIATIAAVADVVAAKSTPVPPAKAAELVDQVRQAAASAPSSYSRCRAVQAIKQLQADPGPLIASAPQAVDTGQPFSAATVMDVYGVACLAEVSGHPLPLETRQRILAWLEPNLGIDIVGQEFEAYYLAKAWTAAGGDRARLVKIAEAAHARTDASSGLLRERVVRLGTLENTYYAALLADTVDAFGDIIGKNTLGSVREALPQLRAHRSIGDLLMAAVVMRIAGAPDRSLEEEATNLGRQWLTDGIQRAEVPAAAQVIALLRQLGQDVPRVHATAFPVVSPEDRYLAWTLLGLVPFLDNADELEMRLSAAVASVGPALATPSDELMVKEVSAAMFVPGSGIDRNNLPAGLVQWSGQVRGCDGHPNLYRPAKSLSACTLEATFQMLAAGLDNTHEAIR